MPTVPNLAKGVRGTHDLADTETRETDRFTIQPTVDNLLSHTEGQLGCRGHTAFPFDAHPS